MALSRNLVVRGPAVANIGGQTIFAQGDINVTEVPNKFEIKVSNRKIEARFKYGYVLMDFLPMFKFTTANCAAMFPHTNPVPGASIYGATDLPVFAHGFDGRKLSVANMQVVKQPKLTLLAGTLPFGPVQLKGIMPNNTSPGANVLVSESSETYTYPTPHPADFLTQKWSPVWGSSSPWNGFNTEGGVVIEFDEKFVEKFNDDQMLYDLIYEDVVATVKTTPLGITAAQVRALTNINMIPGSSYLPTANNFVLTGADGTVITVFQTDAEDGNSLLWDTVKDRVGELIFRSTPQVVSGAYGPVFGLTCLS
jgi:hypothetical protein